MQKISIHSIAAKYFLSTSMLIILPLCIFFFIAQKISFNTTMEQKRESDLNTLNTFSESIAISMDSVLSVGKLAASDPDVRQFLRDSVQKAGQSGKTTYKSLDNRPCLGKYTGCSGMVCAVSLMDPDYFFIGEQRLDLNRLTYFFNTATIQELGPVQSQPAWSKTFNIQFLATGDVRKVFALVAPSVDDDGTLLGYVVLFADSALFSRQLDAYADDIYVIEGDLIIGSRGDLMSNSNLFSQMQISYSLLLEDNSVIIKKENDSLIITTRYFAPLGTHLLLVSSYQELENRIATTFPPLMTLVTYGICLALLLAFVITHFQTREIVRLKNVMSQMKEGDLSIRYEPKTRDEIAELGLTFNSLLDRIQELMLQQKNHQKAKRRMELQMIHEQVKPHFLYNVLEMINSMIRCQMAQEALATVESLASFYRISLNRGSDIISVSQEIQLIENYLNLQKMRYIEFMDYILAFSPEIRRYAIPKLTLQPLIENSIYHGIKEKDGQGTICVSGYLDGGRVVFEVFDNGVGCAPDLLEQLQAMTGPANTEPEDHFGLASVIRRLNIHFNDQARIKIESRQNEFTCVMISFPAVFYRQDREDTEPDART